MDPSRAMRVGASSWVVRSGRSFHPNQLQRQRQLPLADPVIGTGLAGEAQRLQMAPALLAVRLAQAVLGGTVFTQLGATAVMQQPLQPGDRCVVVAFVAASTRFGLQELQPLQSLALQQAMGPADRVLLPGQMPLATCEHQLQRPDPELPATACGPV
jgi:hypothetical protein